MGESRNGLYFVLRVLLYLIVGCSFASPVCLSCSVYISYSVCCCVTSVMLIHRVTSITSLVFHLSCKQTRPFKKKKKGEKWLNWLPFLFHSWRVHSLSRFKCIQNLLLLQVVGFLTLNREPLVQVFFSIALFFIPHWQIEFALHLFFFFCFSYLISSFCLIWFIYRETDCMSSSSSTTSSDHSAPFFFSSVYSLHSSSVGRLQKCSASWARSVLLLIN